MGTHPVGVIRRYTIMHHLYYQYEVWYLVPDTVYSDTSDLHDVVIRDMTLCGCQHDL
jgi:hypothetical protein